VLLSFIHFTVVVGENLATYANSSRGGMVFISLSLSFPHNVSKTDPGRTTKLDIETFQDESWKPIYFGVKR